MASGHDIREIHVVCNTHWDREFRETFEVTRRHLVDMMDTTLDILDRDPEYKSFTLDAHVILLEDYLEMRPERLPDVERLLAERRLFIGPWYTLPDSMNIGGEALVRNFLRARKVAKRLGAECMNAGYSPNNWGQPSQMPQIFRGFGVDSALIYRGISLHECPSEFIWVGADGSEIFGHRFGKLARYNWYYLVYRPVTRGVEPTDKLYPMAGSTEKPFRIADRKSRATHNFRLLDPTSDIDPDKVAESIEAMLDLEGPDSSTGLFLAMHGHDVSVAHPQDAEIVKIAQEKLGDKYDIKMSNLEDFVSRLREELDKDKAVKLYGERRMNLKEGFWTYLLPCTISARTYLKILNTRAENMLHGEAEPMSVLASLLGGEYPDAYLDRAWKFLLENHTHDANAGCSPDRVCKDMEYRYDQCMDIANICAEDAMKFCAKNLAPHGDGTSLAEVMVFNPLPYERDSVVEFDVTIAGDVDAENLKVIDDEGNACESVILDSQDSSLFVDNHWDVPTYADVRQCRMQARVEKLPGLGYRTLRVEPMENFAFPKMIANEDDYMLENEYIRVEVREDGTFDLKDKRTDAEYCQLNRFRDEGEGGNAWQHEPPADGERITYPDDEEDGLGAIEPEIVENTPLSATIRVEISLTIPDAEMLELHKEFPEEPLDPDIEAEFYTEMLIVDCYYTVKKGDPRVYVRVVVDNEVPEHWLRAEFPTFIETDTVFADTHFDLVERAIEHPDDTGWIERFRGTAPMHSLVDLSDGKNGLAVLTEGLFEYEITDNRNRTILLSLLRAFPIKLQVSEEKMEILPDKGPQCYGEQEFRYAVMPHAGNVIDGDVYKWAQQFNNSPRVAQVSPTDGTLPREAGMVRVEGDGLYATSVKQAEDGIGWIVRLFNGDADMREGEVHIGKPLKNVRMLNLDESVIGDIEHDGSSVKLSVPPKKIITLNIEIADN